MDDNMTTGQPVNQTIEQPAMQTPVMQPTPEQPPMQQAGAVNGGADDFIDSSSEALEERLPNIVPVNNDGKGVENVILKEVKLGKSPSAGSDMISFVFQQLNSQGQPIAEQVISEYDPTVNNLQLSPDEFKKSKTATISRIKHMAHGYIPKAETEFQATGFVNWCTILIQRLGSRYKGVKGRIKFIYNTKGYVTIPRYGHFLSTSVRETPPFEFDPRYDRLTKPSGDSAMSNAPTASTGQDAADAFGG